MRYLVAISFKKKFKNHAIWGYASVWDNKGKGLEARGGRLERGR